jgi:thiosulfate/3-mercaptopyruvate sulfurtransferase
MFSRKQVRFARRFVKGAVIAALIAFGGLSPGAQSQTGQPTAPEVLPASQLVQPADLARELASTSGDARPTILYVGFRTLFAGGHIPGATFHGSASTKQGLADIKNWAASLPRTTNIVVYCGCCPFERCPNIRPAFALLRDMGFLRLRVLDLPTSFATDWADKNYPIEKGL